MVLSREASRMSSSNSLRRCWTQVQGTRLSVHGKHCKPGQDTGSAVTCCDSAQMYSSSTDEPAGGEEKETDNQFRLLPPPPPVRIPSWMVGLVRGWGGREVWEAHLGNSLLPTCFCALLKQRVASPVPSIDALEAVVWKLSNR